MGLSIWDQKGWYQVASLPNREVFSKTRSWVLDKTSNTVTKMDRQRERTKKYIVNTSVWGIENLAVRHRKTIKGS